MEFFTISHVPTLLIIAFGFPFSQLPPAFHVASLDGSPIGWIRLETRRQESLIDAEASLLRHTGRIEKVVSGSVEAKRNIQLRYKGINFLNWIVKLWNPMLIGELYKVFMDLEMPFNVILNWGKGGQTLNPTSTSYLEVDCPWRWYITLVSNFLHPREVPRQRLRWELLATWENELLNSEGDIWEAHYCIYYMLYYITYQGCMMLLRWREWMMVGSNKTGAGVRAKGMMEREG